MAVASYLTTTSSVNLNKIWRKVQGELQVGMQFMSEEYEMVDELPNINVNWSAREITVPIDIFEGAGIASIPEGGYEAIPYSPNVAEIQFTWVLFNGRFTASRTAKYIDSLNPEAELKKQLYYQGMKKLQDFGRHFSDYFYGFGTGVLAINTTSATQTSGAYTLSNAYGLSAYNTSPSFIADKFRVNDRVALISAGALVTNAIGTITAISRSTPSITVTWNGSVTSAGTEQVVKANSLENTTIAGTDFNGGMTGLLDQTTSASVYGLSNGTAPNWQAALQDVSGGRFSGVRLHKYRDTIFNLGGGKLQTVICSQGVYRDVLALQQAALRFNDPFALEIDGDIKSKGVAFFKSRRVPPGTVFCFDRKSENRMTLLPKPSERVAWEDGFKLQDQSGFVFSLDLPIQMVCTNRQNLVLAQSLTEQ